MRSQATGQRQNKPEFGRSTIVATVRMRPEHRDRMRKLAERNYRTFTSEVALAIANHLDREAA